MCNLLNWIVSRSWILIDTGGFHRLDLRWYER